jgi:2-phosphosulfolactate phosphatase
MFEFMRSKDASHYHRLNGYGLEKDIRYCLTPDLAPVLPLYENGKLIVL